MYSVALVPGSKQIPPSVRYSSWELWLRIAFVTEARRFATTLIWIIILSVCDIESSHQLQTNLSGEREHGESSGGCEGGGVGVAGQAHLEETCWSSEEVLHPGRGLLLSLLQHLSPRRHDSHLSNCAGTVTQPHSEQSFAMINVSSSSGWTTMHWCCKVEDAISITRSIFTWLCRSDLGEIDA